MLSSLLPYLCPQKEILQTLLTTVTGLSPTSCVNTPLWQCTIFHFPFYTCARRNPIVALAFIIIVLYTSLTFITNPSLPLSYRSGEEVYHRGTTLFSLHTLYEIFVGQVFNAHNVQFYFIQTSNSKGLFINKLHWIPPYTSSL